MLIAEDLSTAVNVPVEVGPMEELEKVLINSNNGTIVTSRYFIQPLEKVAKQHGVRAITVDLSDFQKELKMDLKITKTLVIQSNEIKWRFSRSSGHGGHNVNKIESRVEIIFNLEDSNVLNVYQKEILKCNLKTILVNNS